MVEAYRNDLAMVMPSHVKPDTFVRLAVGVLRRDKNLAVRPRRTTRPPSWAR
jgi:recombination protein RecT